jgi:hypothetical protein
MNKPDQIDADLRAESWICVRVLDADTPRSVRMRL